MKVLSKGLIIVFVFIFSCKKDKELDPCILNPTENNATLKRLIGLELKHNMDSCSINLVSQFNKKAQKEEYFFVVTNSSPILQYHFIKNAEIINCGGSDIAEYYSKEDYVRFFKTAKFLKRIWKKEQNTPIESIGSCGTLNPMSNLPYFVMLKTNLEKYAWKSLIYQYKFKGKTLYYGLYTRIDQEGQKLADVAAMDCEGNNQLVVPGWNQKDFLENAILETANLLKKSPKKLNFQGLKLFAYWLFFLFVFLAIFFKYTLQMVGNNFS